MGYFNFYILKQLLRYIRKNKKIFIAICIFIIFLFVKNMCFAVQPSPVFDYEQELRDEEDKVLLQFVSHCLYPYSSNTEYWNDCIKPIFDLISEGYDYYITMSNNDSRVAFDIYLYKSSQRFDTTLYTMTSKFDNNSYDVWCGQYNNQQYMKYTLRWFPSTNTGTLTLNTGQGWWYHPVALMNYTNEPMVEFIREVRLGTGEIGATLNTISNYLDNIDSVNSDILSLLGTISSSLSQVSQNTSTDYSQGISQISNKISDILDDNDEIISQNAEMISQQEQINENLENVDESVQELKDTITDPSISSGASDLPSTNVNDPTSGGIDNIFQSIYNAFCVGEAQDIVFPIPFTDKNITLSPYYVSDMLNNNNAGWIYTIIQAFWGYLIGRYIVSDISKKIDKIKSGNIENVENSNIKEEML